MSSAHAGAGGSSECISWCNKASNCEKSKLSARDI